MILEIRVKVPLPGHFDDRRLEDVVDEIYMEYTSLAYLVADLVEGNDAAMYLNVDGQRLVLQGVERACANCLEIMQYQDYGPVPWLCNGCGQTEGRRASNLRG